MVLSSGIPSSQLLHSFHPSASSLFSLEEWTSDRQEAMPVRQPPVPPLLKQNRRGVPEAFRRRQPYPCHWFPPQQYCDDHEKPKLPELPVSVQNHAPEL